MTHLNKLDEDSRVEDFTKVQKKRTVLRSRSSTMVQSFDDDIEVKVNKIKPLKKTYVRAFDRPNLTFVNLATALVISWVINSHDFRDFYNSLRSLLRWCTSFIVSKRCRSLFLCHYNISHGDICCWNHVQFACNWRVFSWPLFLAWLHFNDFINCRYWLALGPYYRQLRWSSKYWLKYFKSTTYFLI